MMNYNSMVHMVSHMILLIIKPYITTRAQQV